MVLVEKHAAAVKYTENKGQLHFINLPSRVNYLEKKQKENERTYRNQNNAVELVLYFYKMKRNQWLYI